jgi:hypothetical protein
MAPSVLLDEPLVQADAIFAKQVGPSHLLTPLPTAFPPDKLIWHGSEYADSDSYTYVLTAPEVKEIDTALLQFKGLFLTPCNSAVSNQVLELGLDGNEINRSNFRLPTLEAKLRDAAAEIQTGKGLLVVSGFETGKYSVEDNTLVFLGISAYIGEQRGKQDDDGNMLGKTTWMQSLENMLTLRHRFI